ELILEPRDRVGFAACQTESSNFVLLQRRIDDVAALDTCRLCPLIGEELTMSVEIIRRGKGELLRGGGDMNHCKRGVLHPQEDPRGCPHHCAADGPQAQRQDPAPAKRLEESAGVR